MLDVQDVRRLRIADGDVLVITLDERSLTADAAHSLQDQIKAWLEPRDIDVVVMPAGTQLDVVSRKDLPSITCPWCGATSYHPMDVAEGYCGRCHDWTGTDTSREVPPPPPVQHNPRIVEDRPA